jgi:hypothetical protein
MAAHPTILRSPDDVVTALARRKDGLGLSNEVLEHLAGLCGGTADKYLGPSRVKTPGLPTLFTILQALGCGLALVDDPEAVSRMESRWTRRQDRFAHGNHKIARAAIARARPAVLSEAGRHAAKARWKNATASERRDAVARMNAGRAAKRGV